MSTLLLKNLNNADIDWLTDVGELQAAKANTILIEPQPNLDKVYLILSGQLSVLLTQQDEAKELLRLSTGDLAGAIPAIASYLPYATVAAITDVSVIAVSAQTLVQKLKQDSVFAANFYRSTAQLLRQQLIYWAGQIGYSLSLMGQLQLKEASTVFAEFIDNDLDWMMAVGQVDAVKPGTPVLSCGRPLDALHILLEGAVSLAGHSHPYPSVTASLCPKFRSAGTGVRPLSQRRLNRGNGFSGTGSGGLFRDRTPRLAPAYHSPLATHRQAPLRLCLCRPALSLTGHTTGQQTTGPVTKAEFFAS
jgi:hypothetical protein